jgi:hypothetical protein
MLPPDYARRAWIKQYEKSFPEHLRPYVWGVWDGVGMDWVRKLCTIDGEFELHELQKYHEGASLLLGVIRQHGLDLARQVFGRDPCDAERWLCELDWLDKQVESGWEWGEDEEARD